jgi:hypothetical protein
MRSDAAEQAAVLDALPVRLKRRLSALKHI